MALPEVLRFENLGDHGEWVLNDPRCFYTKGEFRAPKKGEWYASGAEPMAYRAKNDLTSAYQIVVPTRYAKPATGFVPGRPVTLP